MTAAKHRLLDRVRHVQMSTREQQALGHEADARGAHLAPDPMDLLLADEADDVGDDALRLISSPVTRSSGAKRNGRSRCAWCPGSRWPRSPARCSRRKRDPQALQALMELQASRLPARTDAQGRPVLLMARDRRRWDRLLPRRGLAALGKCRSLHAARAQPPRPLALQAELAAVHARASRAEDTDWHEMLRLYDSLLALQPTPAVALNRAIALSHAIGPLPALALVETLAPAGYPWWASARADLLQRLGRINEARAALRQAIDWTVNIRECELLQERLDRMAA